MVEANALRVGACVLVRTVGTTGTVTGFTTTPIPGVKVKLHRPVNGLDTCTASYRECEVIRRTESAEDDQ